MRGKEQCCPKWWVADWLPQRLPLIGGQGREQGFAWRWHGVDARVFVQSGLFYCSLLASYTRLPRTSTAARYHHEVNCTGQSVWHRRQGSQSSSHFPKCVFREFCCDEMLTAFAASEGSSHPADAPPRGRPAILQWHHAAAAVRDALQEILRSSPGAGHTAPDPR